jgi:hypothetical protein
MTKRRHPANRAGQAEPRERRLDDDEQRIRALTRELHEATKDARAAARELDEKMKRWGGSATAYYRRVLSEHDKVLRSEIEEAATTVRKLTDEAGQQYREHSAKLLGMQSADELLTSLTIGLAQRIAPICEQAAAKAVNVKLFRRIVIDEIAKSMAKRLDADMTDDDEQTAEAARALFQLIDPTLDRLASVDIKTYIIESKDERKS